MKINKTVIVLGYSCNNNCIFCCMSDRRKKVNDRSYNKVIKDIKTAKKNGCTYLELIGGEPTLRKDIIKIISYAKLLDFDTISITTNGRMFSIVDFANKIINAGLNQIIFSIHGHNAKLHDSLTQSKGSFNQLIKGIKNINALEFKNIGSNTTIVKQNYGSLLDIGKFIYSLGIQNSEFIFVDPTHGNPKNNFKEIVPTYDEISDSVNKLLEFGKKYFIPHWHIRYYPLCFINEEYHDMVSELNEKISFSTKHIALDFSNNNVEINREKFGRQKINKCKECKYSNLCEGYWKEYIIKYNI